MSLELKLRLEIASVMEQRDALERRLLSLRKELDDAVKREVSEFLENNLEFITDLYCEAVDGDALKIRNKPQTRKRIVVDQRSSLIYAILHFYQYRVNYSMIGRFFGVDRTTVLSVIDRMKDLTDVQDKAIMPYVDAGTRIIEGFEISRRSEAQKGLLLNA